MNAEQVVKALRTHDGEDGFLICLTPHDQLIAVEPCYHMYLETAGNYEEAIFADEDGDDIIVRLSGRKFFRYCIPEDVEFNYRFRLSRKEDKLYVSEFFINDKPVWFGFGEFEHELFNCEESLRWQIWHLIKLFGDDRFYLP